MKVLVIHGPALDTLGSREPEIYGAETLQDIDDYLVSQGRAIGIEVTTRQTAREGEIVEWLIGASGSFDGVVLNPAAYSHTSRAIADAIRSVDVPVVEVHISNIHAREGWRARSVTAEAAVGVIAGFHKDSYLLGLRALLSIREERGS